MLQIQIGIMAACVVLFVPMGLAGWHLSRNKMLFFSGALFITLAVGVHLTPYFPPISSFFLSSSSNPTTLPSSLPPLDVNDRSHSSSRDNNSDGCLSYLHDVSYFSTSGARDWDWIRSAPVVDCDFQKLSPSDAADLLNGSWVVVAGDSQARFFALSLLALLLDDIDSVAAHLFKRHSDYHTVIPQSGIQFDFVWAPYVTNLTDLLSEFKHNSTYPDVLMMGSGLWHMLRINDAFDYGVVLAKLKNSLQAYLPAFSSEKNVRSPHLFWIGMPTLINSMLNTEEKREKMTNATCNAYLSRILHSKLLRHTGGPLLLLDIQRLTRSCGARCTEDGMHYVGAVYEAAVHIMLNALLIESHQKL